MNFLEIHNLSKSFDEGKTMVLQSISFTLQKGKVLAVVGESGSGKTTLIRLICGLETPDDGDIKLNEQTISSIETMTPPEKRNIGLVFQEYALFPHLSVYANISYGVPKNADQQNKVTEVLELVGLTGYEKRYPHQLSGGQQQRVALARAIAPKPDLLILDEPFSNLDAILRDQLRQEIFDIISKTGVTAIFVTHDTEDALSVSDHIMILQNGKLVQQAKPEKLFHQPQSSYVASLFSKVIHLSETELRTLNFPAEVDYTYAIRAQAIRINIEMDYTMEVMVLNTIFMGNYYKLQVQTETGNIMTIPAPKTDVEEKITIGFMKEDILSFLT